LFKGGPCGISLFFVAVLYGDLFMARAREIRLLRKATVRVSPGMQACIVPLKGFFRPCGEREREGMMPGKRKIVTFARKYFARPFVSVAPVKGAGMAQQECWSHDGTIPEDTDVIPYGTEILYPNL